MAFCWSSIIWTQALAHKNLQVQRMALKTLLKRSWTPHMLQQVPPSFVTQVLLPALLSPIHHKPPCLITAAGVVLHPSLQAQQDAAGGDDTPASSSSSGSGSSSSFDVTAHAGQLLGAYVACAGRAAARQVFEGGLQVAVAEGADLPRSGLLALLRVLAAAAQQVAGGAAAVGSPQQLHLLDDLPPADAGACGCRFALLGRLHHCHRPGLGRHCLAALADVCPVCLSCTRPCS
jgi:hypothetical protein